MAKRKPETVQTQARAQSATTNTVVSNSVSMGEFVDLDVDPDHTAYQVVLSNPSGGAYVQQDRLSPTKLRVRLRGGGADKVIALPLLFE